ncbi:class I adenylate-forming enzyme family protein [Novosphingobium sp. Gsoil 351]|uniref:class I adenylate-forming enzyme family protein n=1 Tax=Novosphingobium sp. Gsoil 351 TaxID=2675225 RepID=UPI0012B4630A|nr:AMP-binding protein [Novosphingobium sp. Gsoil 351]QGN54183.1 AMP-binding protein [Novosphingobium sp. Gsoil 351]
MTAGASTLDKLYQRAAASSPDRRLVVVSKVRPADLSLGEIYRRGELVGSALHRLGVEPGDIVAVQLPAWSEWLVAAVAIARCGAILLPVVSTYRAKELGFILRQSKAKVLITPDRFRKADFVRILADCGSLPTLQHHIVIGEAPSEALSWSVFEQPCEPVPKMTVDPETMAMLVYTSGTTADPKGVRHSHRSLLAEIVATNWERRELEVERVFSPWPPGHVAGAITLMRFLAGQTELVLTDQWDPAIAAELVERFAINSASFTPFHLQGILDAADRDSRDLSSLVNCLVGAAPVPTGLIARAEARGLRPYRSYGSSEHPTVTAGNPHDPIAKRLGSEGRPTCGCEITFVDEAGRQLPEGEEGELVTRGPELFQGYLDPALDAQAFLPDRWFRTGDIGRRDAEGYLVITDRIKDVIIRGGENISSREVEDVLFTHPNITESAVVAAPDERLGEIVCAFVVTGFGPQPTIASVRSYFSSVGAAPGKAPERLEIVSELPRNAIGKVLKQELRRRARSLAHAK